MSAISLFVPHVFCNFDRDYVARAFAKIGDVVRVDFVAKQDRDGKSYNAAYIHFKSWHDNYVANEMRGRIATAGKSEFYHDKSEYYWIVLPNTAKKVVSGDRKPRLDLGEAKAINMKTVEETTNKLSIYSAPVKEEEFVPCSIEEAEMDEIEAAMEEEDANLVSIDGRYVQIIEQENAYLHVEVAQLRMALMNLDMMYRLEVSKAMSISKDFEMKFQTEN